MDAREGERGEELAEKDEGDENVDGVGGDDVLVGDLVEGLRPGGFRAVVVVLRGRGGGGEEVLGTGDDGVAPAADTGGVDISAGTLRY